MALSRAELKLLNDASEEDLLPVALGHLKGRVAVVSSFGAESAVLLAQIARIDRDTPVFFLDTGRHFPETLAYREQLSAHLGLRDVRTLAPSTQALHDRDPEDQLAAFDPDACCKLRKVEPLESVSGLFDAWITGRKRAQAATRKRLELVEQTPDGQIKLNPLAYRGPDWIANAMEAWHLPRHRLVSQGFTSIGCAPCTRAVRPGEDPRAGRWAGMAKTECGIHRPT